MTAKKSLNLFIKHENMLSHEKHVIEKNDKLCFYILKGSNV